MPSNGDSCDASWFVEMRGKRLKSGAATMIKVQQKEDEEEVKAPEVCVCKVVSSRGPSPQEELAACRPFMDLSGNMFIQKDRRLKWPLQKVEVSLKGTIDKKLLDSLTHEARDTLFRNELSAVLTQATREPSSAGRPRDQSPPLPPPPPVSDHKRVMSFSGTLQVEQEEPDVGLCRRCGHMVYPLEKVDPGVGQVYHQRCFRCCICKTKLSLATYCKNLQASNDPRVYCKTHQPRLDKAFSMDSTALPIAMALKNTREMKINQPPFLPPSGKIVIN